VSTKVTQRNSIYLLEYLCILHYVPVPSKVNQLCAWVVVGRVIVSTVRCRCLLVECEEQHMLLAIRILGYTQPREDN
jgi:hypothetical protein